MRKGKKTILTTLCLLSMTSILLPVTAFANEAKTPSKAEIERWEYEATSRSNPVAQLEGRAARSFTLVGSDVRCIYSGSGDYGYVWGYTDVKDGDNDAYHYTRVEMRTKQVSGIIASGKESGYGYVEAETEDVEHALSLKDVYGRVYWGEIN